MTIDRALHARFVASSLTVYSVDEIDAAIIEWHVARDAYDAALDRFDDVQRQSRLAKFDEKFGSLRGIWACRTDLLFNEMETKLLKIDDRVSMRCPLEMKLRSHSHEIYPVDKTRKEAATLRNAAKEIEKLTNG